MVQALDYFSHKTWRRGSSSPGNMKSLSDSDLLLRPFIVPQTERGSRLSLNITILELESNNENNFVMPFIFLGLDNRNHTVQNVNVFKNIFQLMLISLHLFD